MFNFFKKYQTVSAPVMSTELFIKAPCSDILFDECIALAQAFEKKYSVYQKKSFISKLNDQASQQPIQLDNEAYHLIEKALEVAKATDGCFDPTIGSLSQKAYAFGSKERLPNRANKKKYATFVDYTKIQLKSNEISFRDANTMLDLGGIAKGYCVDLIIKHLKKSGIKKALVSIGGEISCYGDSFTIGIAHPRQEGMFAYLKTKKISTHVSTSGDYERFIKNYDHNHILDASNGHSSSQYASVSLITTEYDTMTLDALNTALFLMDETQQETVLKNYNVGLFCIDKELTSRQKSLQNKCALFKIIA